MIVLPAATNEPNPGREGQQRGGGARGATNAAAVPNGECGARSPPPAVQLILLRASVWLPDLARAPCLLHCLHASPWLHQLEHAECWENAVDEVIAHFEREQQRRATYTVCYY
jgi:hypothetical protein